MQLCKYQKLAKIQRAAEVLAIATEALREEQYQVFRQHWYQLQARDFRCEILESLNE